MKLKKIILFISFMMFQNNYAQKSSFKNWINHTRNQSFSKKWNWHNKLQLRNYNLAEDTEQLSLKTSIGCNLTPNNNIIFAHAYVKTYNYTPDTDYKSMFEVHRIFQQYIQRAQFGKLQIQHRYQQEKRFIENNFRLWFRYFLGLTLPLNKPSITQGSLYASISNELFIHSDRPLYGRDRFLQLSATA